MRETGPGAAAATAIMLLAGCTPAASENQLPTPAVGVIEPAAIYPVADADGVSTDITVIDSYQGTTYGGASDAFILEATVSVDGNPVATVEAQYLITYGSPGSGTYATSFALGLGALSAGNHVLTVAFTSPPDFEGQNQSAVSTTYLVPPPATGG
jgi:hypothetical protein